MATSPYFDGFVARNHGQIGAICLAGLLIGAPFNTALAQVTDSAGPANTEASSDYVERLKSCQQIVDDIARLDCFDAAVSNIVTASDAGDLQVVDREEVRQTRRSLFGFTLPNLGIFGGDDDDEEEELFSTTIERVRYTGRSSVEITTAEGAVWLMNNVPRNRRRFETGDTVVFKKASFGNYFLRINGRTGLKGRRIR